MCFLCNQPIEASDVVYQVDGQRLGVHLTLCDGKLREQPQRWVARLKARGAFLSAPLDRGALSTGWFLAGLWVLAGLVFAGLCAHRALHTGRRMVPWFFAGLAFNSLAYVVLLTRPKLAAAPVPSGLRKVAATWDPLPCTACGSTNHPGASQCLACGARLKPVLASEATRC